MANILITGGAGYIGSHLVYLLGEKGHDLTVYDNLSTGRKANVHFGEFVEADLADLDKLRSVIRSRKIDSVVHFAGSIVVPESVEKPLEYYANNTSNSLNLINMCVEESVSNFIFSSTAAVYGLPDGGVCKETSLLNPINPYGRSKLMTEWMLQDAAFAHENFNYVALRYFNVSGAHVGGKTGQSGPNSTHLLKIACEAALGKRKGMAIYGTDYDTEDGTCIRDYIHVDDLALAHEYALNYLIKNNRSDVFNCGYGHGYSVKEVIEVVKKVSGVDFKVDIDGRRAGDAAKLVANSDKLKEATGWKPKHDDLELIVKTALEWERKLS